MPDYDISSRVSLMGDKEYKKAVQGIDQELKALKSDMDASQASFADQKGSMAQLQDASKKLSAVYEKQSERVEMMTAKLNQMVESGEANEYEINRYRTALNKAKAEMNRTAAEIRQTDKAMQQLEQGTENSEDATEDNTKALREEGKAADEAQEKTGGLKGKLAEIAKNGAAGALKAVGAAAAAAGAAMAGAAKGAFDLAKDGGKYADDLLTQSAVTGIATDTLQEWGLVSRLIDVDTETMTKSMTKLTQTMGSGSKASKKLFKQLGVSTKDAKGNLRDSEDVFYDCIEALGKIDNETKRDAIAMKLFGKSAQELNPLIQKGRWGLEAVTSEARELGGVLDDQALEALGNFDDAMQRFEYTGQGLKHTIAAVIAPAFEPMLYEATQAMADVSNALSDGLQPGELDSIIKKLTKRVKWLFEGIIGMAKEAMPELMAGVTTMLSTLAEQLPGLIEVLLPGAMDLLSGVLKAITDNATEIGKAAGTIVATLATGLVKAVPQLVRAVPTLVKGIWEGLKSVDWAALGKELLTATLDGLKDIGAQIKALFLEGKAAAEEVDWPAVGATILEKVKTALFSLAETLAGLFVTGLDLIKDVDWASIGSTMMELLKTSLTTLGETLAGLFAIALDLIKQVDWGAIGSTMLELIKTNLATLGEVLTTLFDLAKDAIKDVNWKEIGEKILEKVKEGASTAWELLKGIFSQAMDTVKRIDWKSIGETILSLVKEGAAGAWQLLKGLFSQAMDSVKRINWKSVGETILSLAKEGLNNLGDALKALFNTGLEKIKEVDWASAGRAIWSAITSAFASVADWGKNLIDGMVGGLSTAVEGAKEKVKGFFKSIWDGVLGVFGIASPSTEAAKAGGFILEGFVGGIAEKITDVTERVKGFFQGIWDSILGIFGGGKKKKNKEETKEAEQAGKDVVDGVVTGMTGVDVTTSAESVGVNIITALKSGLELEKGTPGQLGKIVVTAFKVGMGKGAEETTRAAKALGKAVLDKIRETLDIRGYASNKGRAIGKAVASGVASGIDQGRSSIEKAAKKAARAAYSKAMEELNAHSPSRLMMKVGGYFDEGFAMGIERGKGMVAQAAQATARTAVDNVRPAAQAAGQTASAQAQAAPAGNVYNISYSGAFTRQEARRFGLSFARGMEDGIVSRGSWSPAH